MVRILIVDDEPEIVMIAEKVLKKAGYETDGVKYGEECLERLKEEKFDLILLDIMMPGGIDGWEVCKKIKSNKKSKDTKVVLFTVRTSAESIERGKKAGADAQINKPYGKEELLSTVETVLKAS
jgi:CheY-like chemotaxis protein